MTTSRRPARNLELRCRSRRGSFEAWVNGPIRGLRSDGERAMSTSTPTRVEPCDRATSVTRSLLGYGVIAGPLYVVISLGQALTRDGFDMTRHAWSLLANGSLGWVQIVNFVLVGAMTIAFAVGLARALPGQRWAPRLVGAYGLSLIAAGVFRADPALGFPPGTPADARE